MTKMWEHCKGILHLTSGILQVSDTAGDGSNTAGERTRVAKRVK